MKLYQSPRAINPDRVVCFLRAKGKLDAVEMEGVSIMAGEHKTDKYRAMSPMSQVPVLELDDGTYLTESRAICTLFEGLFPEPNLMGADPVEKAKIEMWDRRIELTWMMPIAQQFRHGHPAMAELEKPQLPEWAAANEKRAKGFGRFLDKHLAENEFIAAGRFTIADITAFLTCGFASLTGWKPYEDHPAIAAWRERVKPMVLG